MAEDVCLVLGPSPPPPLSPRQRLCPSKGRSATGQEGQWSLLGACFFPPALWEEGGWPAKLIHDGMRGLRYFVLCVRGSGLFSGSDSPPSVPLPAQLTVVLPSLLSSCPAVLSSYRPAQPYCRPIVLLSCAVVLPNYAVVLPNYAVVLPSCTVVLPNCPVVLAKILPSRTHYCRTG